MDNALEMVGITKRFPGTLAVDHVDFSVKQGEVHALLGENGAGKSTLMKVLVGAFNDYEGQILIAGKQAAIHSPASAKNCGIQMVHQELNLSMPQSIAENLLAGNLPVRAKFLVNKREMVRFAAAALGRLGLELDPMTPVSQLSLHEAQLVEIAKALSKQPRILILDEPTSALTRDDVELLFAIIRRLREEGLAIIYISHHLSEVFQIADRATVMRDGKVVGVRDVCGSTPEELVRLMVGRNLSESRPEPASETGSVVLELDHVSRLGFFLDASFQLRAGEVVGLCGLAGAGRSELARSVCGIDPLHSGQIRIDGQAVKIKNLSQALNNGIAYLTEDRKQQGLALRLDVASNMMSALVPRSGIGPLYGRKSGSAVLRALTDDLQISPSNPNILTRNLSGGNQQKVLLAKWLALGPKVIILDEPTRGVDVGAKEIIHEAIRSLAKQGKAVLLISSDLPELLQLSNRILVMRKGMLAGELQGADATEERLLLAANGLAGVAF